jgi:hypothetical protein
MLRRVALGEVILALFFAALGLLWVIASLRMPLWEGFAPQSGFMPLCFGPAVFLFLLFLFALVERLPILTSLLVAAATTVILFLIFRTWLGVQLPIGPLGI